MMETRAHHVLIGLFTVLAVGSALLFALWMGKSSIDREFKLYEVVFKEAVNGLSVGSSVQYSGIKVGDVVSLHLDPQDPRQVQAIVRVGEDTPIKENTHARLALTSITGGAVIQLYGGTPTSPALATRNDRPTVIVADPSPLSRLLTNGEDLVTNINHLLANANRMFSSENIERVGSTLASLEQTAGAVASQRGEIRQTLTELAETSRQASLLLQRTNRTMGDANELLDQQGRSVMDSAAQTMASLERTSANLEQLLTRNQDALGGGLQGIGEIGPAILELRSTLASLRQMTQRLSDNPGAVLLDRQQNKEFQP